MGIKGFQGWLRSKNKELVKDSLHSLVKDTKVRRLFFDLNALVHVAVNEVYDTKDKKLAKKMEEDSTKFWKDVVEGLANKIIFIILMIRPVYLVYLAADGSVSKAKILQQRQRTYKNASNKIFNRNNVKPGTLFMAFLSTYLRETLKTKLGRLQSIIEDMIDSFDEEKSSADMKEVVSFLKNNKYNGPGEVKFSDACKKGEGEHKIIRVLREEKKIKAIEFKRMMDVIYSPDADMHILTMMYLDEVDKGDLVIMRHKHRHAEEEVDEKAPAYEFFYTSKIRRVLKQQGIYSMIDFAIISCFAGNDFLPALSYLKYGEGNTFEAIKNSYTETFPNNRESHIYKGGKIDWPNLLLYMRALIRKSYMFMLSAGRQQLENPDMFYDEKTGEDRRFEPLIRAMKIQKPTKNRPGKNYEFHSDFFDKQYNEYITRTHHTGEKDDIDYNTIPEMCKNYLEGLVWVVEYYKQERKFVNQNWGYMFHYPPNPEDLYSYLEDNLENPDWTNIPLLVEKKGEEILPPFEPLEQLIAILRKEDLVLLPEILRVLVIEKLPFLYPEKILIDRTFVKFGDDHDAVVLANFPDMDRIRELHSLISEDPIVASRNKNRLQETVWKLVKK